MGQDTQDTTIPNSQPPQAIRTIHPLPHRQMPRMDHGHGISTLYMHMKDINVIKGQKVKQGQVVGTLGKTGRATGPHLDIRLNWFDVKLDPMTILR